MFHESLPALPDRGEMIGYSFPYSSLEVAVALAGEILFNLFKGKTGDSPIDGHQVVDAFLALSITQPPKLG